MSLSNNPNIRTMNIFDFKRAEAPALYFEAMSGNKSNGTRSAVHCAVAYLVGAVTIEWQYSQETSL